MKYNIGDYIVVKYLFVNYKALIKEIKHNDIGVDYYISNIINKSMNMIMKNVPFFNFEINKKITDKKIISKLKLKGLI